MVVDLPKIRSWFTSPTPVPATLHACAQSRQVTLKTHQLCFPRMIDEKRNDLATDRPAVYSNLAQDTVFFRPTYNSNRLFFNIFPSRIPQEDLERIRSITLTAGIRQAFTTLVFACPSLKDIRLAVEAPHLDFTLPILCSPLQKSGYGDFVKKYRAACIFGGVHTTGLSPSAAVDKIKDRHLKDIPGIEQRLKLGDLKLSLVKVHN